MRILRVIYYAILMVRAKLKEDTEEFRQLLITLAQKQGGLYIKFMQVLAMQRGLFSEKLSKEFLDLYDAVGVEELDIKAKLKKELGTNVNQITGIEEHPFASGTFAQVYKAKHINGKDIIVKVKKSNIYFNLIIDFTMLSIVTAILDSVYKVQIIDPQKILKKFIRNTFKELDYKAEARNAKCMYDCYLDNPRVLVPHTYKELCTKNTIVQDFVSGLPLTTLIRAKAEHPDLYNALIAEYQIDIQGLLRSIGYELSVQGPKYEKFYGDPHPGNIIVLGHNRFAFIDFGLLDDIDVDRRNLHIIIEAIVNINSTSNIEELAVELLKFGAKDLYNALTTLDNNLKTNSDDKLLAMISNNYSAMIKTKAEFFNIKKEAIGGITEVFYEVIRMGNKYNIKVPEALLNMMRSSAIFGSYARFLLPETDVMPEVYVQMLDEFRSHKAMTKTPKFQDTEDALLYLEDWIVGLAEKDAFLYQSIRKSVKL